MHAYTKREERVGGICTAEKFAKEGGPASHLHTLYLVRIAAQVAQVNNGKFA